MFFNFAYQYYYLIGGLQAFCLFHAYRSRSEQKWFYLIIFLPLIGCLIYLYEHFYSRRNMENLAEGVKHTLFSNYAIEKLEKEAKFTATVTNKTLLADAYVQNARYPEAIQLYESCLHPTGTNSPDLLRKLLKAHFLSKDYPAAVRLGNQLGSDKDFRNSEEKISFAWALHYTGDSPKAEEKFREMDSAFSNFPHRLEFARFLLATSRPEAAREKLNELLEEYDAMSGYEQGLKKGVAQEARGLLRGIR